MSEANTYKFTSKEDIEEAVDGCSSTGFGCGAQDVIARLLAEREAFREVAAELQRQINSLTDRLEIEYDIVNAEARRMLEEGK